MHAQINVARLGTGLGHAPAGKRKHNLIGSTLLAGIPELQKEQRTHHHSDHELCSD